MLRARLTSVVAVLMAALTLGACASGARSDFGLSEREAEVLFWISEGKSNPEIALIIGAAAGTVKKHVENLLAKLAVENRAAAMRLALEKLR